MHASQNSSLSMSKLDIAEILPANFRVGGLYVLYRPRFSPRVQSLVSGFKSESVEKLLMNVNDL